MTQVEIGKAVPKFNLPATGDTTVTQSDLKGTTTVLYFYPRDNTPGCTQESQEFRDNYNKFKRLGVQVFGISRDSLKSHDKFKDKFDFPFELISDEDETLCQIFGVMKDKNMYGKKVRGIERSTFIINDKGKLVHEWRKVKVDGHVDDVLATLRALK